MIENFNDFEISNEENIIGGCRRRRRKYSDLWEGYKNWFSNKYASQAAEPVVDLPPVVEPEIVKAPAPPGGGFSEADTIGGRPGNNTILVINIDVSFGSLTIQLSSIG